MVVWLTVDITLEVTQMAAGYSVAQAMALVILFQLLLVIVSLLVLLMENSSFLQGLFQNLETEAQTPEQESSTL
jgi:hypothetical protein